AWWAATSLVDPMVGKNSNRDPSGASRACTTATASASSLGSALPRGIREASADRFDVKADVDGRRRMREGAGGDEVRSRRRQFGDAFQRDAAGDLDFRAAGDPLDRATDVAGGHVVDEDHVSAGANGFLDLRQGVGLDFDGESRILRAR